MYHICNDYKVEMFFFNLNLLKSQAHNRYFHFGLYNILKYIRLNVYRFLKDYDKLDQKLYI
jgi:hypothetical protein